MSCVVISVNYGLKRAVRAFAIFVERRFREHQTTGDRDRDCVQFGAHLTGRLLGIARNNVIGISGMVVEWTRHRVSDAIK